ncbi:hypothetical protein A4X06_0g8949 [Tilletia controversa]|uniref:Reverse transcriptase/retrotransposon-derived protein RNase H-like domain-containing protein n=1 Tax=Tilletia controversa TaxID=13291 RepID=A0A8X7MJ47_9BASI|nr:hypothetical protein A4X06_0g8949 [Tilletia controversa]
MDLSRSLKSWHRSIAESSPSEVKTARRVTFTRAEDDGNDVLPEIDIAAPQDRQQTVFCSAGLTVDQRSRLMKVLESHAVWPTPLRPLGLYEYGEVSLRLREGQDQWTHTEPPSRTSPAQKDVIDDTLREHDDLGISEPSQGSYASGVVLVQQRDKIRFCNDYRPLNKVTVDDYYAMPTVDAIFDQLGQSKKDFAARAQPINKSFVGSTFVWDVAERAAFEDLKAAITTAPVLARPDFRRPFVLAVDASKQGLGGVLLQTDDNGEERPLLYVSRQTTDGEKRYAPTHLELAAVWWCVKKLHHYLDGSSLEVRTDHNALKWLWDLKPSEMHETRVQKFKMALAPLENKIKIS